MPPNPAMPGQPEFQSAPNQPVGMPGTPALQPQATVVQNSVKPKKGHKKVLVIFILFILFAVVGVAIWWFFFRNSYSETSGQTEISYNYSEAGVPKFIDGKFSDREIISADDALNALEDIQEQMQISNVRDELKLDTEDENDGIKYYKFAQFYQEIPVYGQGLIVTVDKNNYLTGLSGYYIPHINISTTPGKGQEEIENIIKNQIGENPNIVSSNLNIWASNDGNEQTLIYVVEAYSDTKAGTYFIDANTGEIISVVDPLESAYNTYQYTGEGLNYQTYTINLTEIGENRYTFHDQARNITITDYRRVGPMMANLFSSLAPGSDVITVSLDNDGRIDTTWNNSTFIESAVSAMARYEYIYDYYKNNLNRNSYDNRGSKIIVNLGVSESTLSSDPLNNAFWSSLTNQMYIGRWKDKYFSASLDVLAHEFTHGVIAHTSKFAGAPKENDKNKAFETGALNEGYADVIGSLIEGKNWTIAEDNEVLRDLVNPDTFNNPASKGGEYYFPDGYLKDGRTLEEFLAHNDLKSVYDYDGGGVHQNANVVGHAAYLMYESGAFKNREEMAKIWYNSLLMLSSYSNFEDSALAIIKSAKNYGLSGASIYRITQALIDTKMLDEKEYALKGTITSGSHKIQSANIEIHAYSDDSLITSFTTNNNGEYSISLQTGTYKIKVSKKDFIDYETVITIKGDTTLDIEISTFVQQEIESGLSKVCTTNDCINFTVYYLEGEEAEGLKENHETYSIPKGAVLDADTLVKSINKAMGTDMLSTDGKTFYMDVGGFRVDCGWYYKGTDEKLDWNVPLVEDVEVEMKVFDGVLDNDLLLDIDSWFH